MFAAAAAWAVTRMSGSRASPPPGSVPVAASVPAPEPEPAAVLDASTDSTVPAVQPERLDTLFYAIQVAASNTWTRALEYANSLEDPRLAAAITPVRLRGRLWYRVLLGALPSATAARAELQRLWRDGLVASGEGAILRTPQAFDLGTLPSAETALEETQRLRERGIPAYRVEASQGTTRIFVGAFETPDQAAVVESLLTAAGLTATLVTRTGNAP